MILTVTQLTERVRARVEPGMADVAVRGEISRWTVAGSGHAYFTLKDAQAVLDAVAWRSHLEQFRFVPEVGMEVVARGAVTVYPPRGRYQLEVRRIDPVGAGPLEIAFRQMRERLEREGLFDPGRKRPLPFLPERILIVTSPSGAALHDILRSIRERHPGVHVILYPVRVQGEGAASEIADAIALANARREADVMIVGRGGGSPEDLWAFNEEALARAIHASAIPVVSAVGHEVDVSISDLVADVRALTPTAAGALVVPDVRELLAGAADCERRLASALRRRVAEERHRVERLGESLCAFAPARRIEQRQQRTDEEAQRLERSLRLLLDRAGERLQGGVYRLDALNPLSVLSRGYSVTWAQGRAKALTDAGQARPGDVLRTRLARGTIRSRVEREAGRE
ncbi:MAG: exodeoxyribonuclease VII large subunit [Planctomycetes bacterium]|nr:exodeoxyribonuclease VII large subunit [Planctomycetota bacterium]